MSVTFTTLALSEKAEVMYMEHNVKIPTDRYISIVGFKQNDIPAGGNRVNRSLSLLPECLRICQMSNIGI